MHKRNLESALAEVFETRSADVTLVRAGIDKHYTNAKADEL
jgi:hypothetical protein